MTRHKNIQDWKARREADLAEHAKSLHWRGGSAIQGDSSPVPVYPLELILRPATVHPDGSISVDGKPIDAVKVELLSLRPACCDLYRSYEEDGYIVETRNPPLMRISDLMGRSAIINIAFCPFCGASLEKEETE